MANTVGSPFVSSGTAQRLPDRKFSVPSKLTIRCGDTDPADRILIRNHPQELVSATKADMFLNGGESISFEATTMLNMQDVSIIAANGTPDIYWGLT